MNEPTAYYAYVYSFFEETNVETEYFSNRKEAERWLRELVEYEGYGRGEYEWGITEAEVRL